METMVGPNTTGAVAEAAEAVVDSPFCAYYHHAAELIGKRWTGAILRALHSGLTRFSELTDVIPQLSDRMLAERLQELQREGIVERVVIPATPVRVEYHLTEKGRALEGVMRAIAAWAYDWLTPHDQPAPACVTEGRDEPAG